MIHGIEAWRYVEFHGPVSCYTYTGPLGILNLETAIEKIVTSQSKRWIQIIETLPTWGVFRPSVSRRPFRGLFNIALLGTCFLSHVPTMTSCGQDPLAPPDRSKRAPPSTVKETPETPQKSEKQLAEERKARDAARKRGEITFDDLKFDIEKGGEFKKEMITKEIEELNTKTVKLRGFILPTSVFQQSGIKQFVLVRDNQECCFGPGAALYDCVIVEMQPGKTATFSTRVVAVKGKLEVDSQSFQYPDGGHYAIYKMTAEEVK